MRVPLVKHATPVVSVRKSSRVTLSKKMESPLWNRTEPL